MHPDPHTAAETRIMIGGVQLRKCRGEGWGLAMEHVPGQWPRPESEWKLGFGATGSRSPIRPAIRSGMTPRYAASLWSSSSGSSGDTRPISPCPGIDRRSLHNDTLRQCGEGGKGIVQSRRARGKGVDAGEEFRTMARRLFDTRKEFGDLR